MTRTFSPAVINGTYLPYPLHGSHSRVPRSGSSKAVSESDGRAVDKERESPARGLSGDVSGEKSVAWARHCSD